MKSSQKVCAASITGAAAATQQKANPMRANNNGSHQKIVMLDEARRSAELKRLRLNAVLKSHGGAAAKKVTTDSTRVFEGRDGRGGGGGGGGGGEEKTTDGNSNAERTAAVGGELMNRKGIGASQVTFLPAPVPTARTHESSLAQRLLENRRREATEKTLRRQQKLKTARTSSEAAPKTPLTSQPSASFNDDIISVAYNDSLLLVNDASPVPDFVTLVTPQEVYDVARQVRSIDDAPPIETTAGGGNVTADDFILGDGAADGRARGLSATSLSLGSRWGSPAGTTKSLNGGDLDDELKSSSSSSPSLSGGDSGAAGFGCKSPSVIVGTGSLAALESAGAPFSMVIQSVDRTVLWPFRHVATSYHVGFAKGVWEDADKGEKRSSAAELFAKLAESEDLLSTLMSKTMNVEQEKRALAATLSDNSGKGTALCASAVPLEPSVSVTATAESSPSSLSALSVNSFPSLPEVSVLDIIEARLSPLPQGRPTVRCVYADSTGVLLHRNMSAAVCGTWGLRLTGAGGGASDDGGENGAGGGGGVAILKGVMDVMSWEPNTLHALTRRRHSRLVIGIPTSQTFFEALESSNEAVISSPDTSTAASPHASRVLALLPDTAAFATTPNAMEWVQRPCAASLSAAASSPKQQQPPLLATSTSPQNMSNAIVFRLPLTDLSNFACQTVSSVVAHARLNYLLTSGRTCTALLAAASHQQPRRRGSGERTHQQLPPSALSIVPWGRPYVYASPPLSPSSSSSLPSVLSEDCRQPRSLASVAQNIPVGGEYVWIPRSMGDRVASAVVPVWAHAQDVEVEVGRGEAVATMAGNALPSVSPSRTRVRRRCVVELELPTTLLMNSRINRMITCVPRSPEMQEVATVRGYQNMPMMPYGQEYDLFLALHDLQLVAHHASRRSNDDLSEADGGGDDTPAVNTAAASGSAAAAATMIENVKRYSLSFRNFRITHIDGVSIDQDRAEAEGAARKLGTAVSGQAVEQGTIASHTHSSLVNDALFTTYNAEHVIRSDAQKGSGTIGEANDLHTEQLLLNRKLWAMMLPSFPQAPLGFWLTMRHPLEVLRAALVWLPQVDRSGQGRPLSQQRIGKPVRIVVSKDGKEEAVIKTNNSGQSETIFTRTVSLWSRIAAVTSSIWGHSTMPMDFAFGFKAAVKGNDRILANQQHKHASNRDASATPKGDAPDELLKRVTSDPNYRSPYFAPAIAMCTKVPSPTETDAKNESLRSLLRHRGYTSAFNASLQSIASHAVVRRIMSRKKRLVEDPAIAFLDESKRVGLLKPWWDPLGVVGPELRRSQDAYQSSSAAVEGITSTMSDSNRKVSGEDEASPSFEHGHPLLVTSDDVARAEASKAAAYKSNSVPKHIQKEVKEKWAHLLMRTDTRRARKHAAHHDAPKDASVRILIEKMWNSLEKQQGNSSSSSDSGAAFSAPPPYQAHFDPLAAANKTISSTFRLRVQSDEPVELIAELAKQQLENLKVKILDMGDDVTESIQTTPNAPLNLSSLSAIAASALPQTELADTRNSVREKRNARGTRWSRVDGIVVDETASEMADALMETFMTAATGDGAAGGKTVRTAQKDSVQSKCDVKGEIQATNRSTLHPSPATPSSSSFFAPSPFRQATLLQRERVGLAVGLSVGAALPLTTTMSPWWVNLFTSNAVSTLEKAAKDAARIDTESRADYIFLIRPQVQVFIAGLLARPRAGMSQWERDVLFIRNDLTTSAKMTKKYASSSSAFSVSRSSQHRRLVMEVKATSSRDMVGNGRLSSQETERVGEKKNVTHPSSPIDVVLAHQAHNGLPHVVRKLSYGLSLFADYSSGSVGGPNGSISIGDGGIRSITGAFARHSGAELTSLLTLAHMVVMPSCTRHSDNIAHSTVQKSAKLVNAQTSPQALPNTTTTSDGMTAKAKLPVSITATHTGAVGGNAPHHSGSRVVDYSAAWQIVEGVSDALNPFLLTSVSVVQGAGASLAATKTPTNAPSSFSSASLSSPSPTFLGHQTSTMRLSMTFLRRLHPATLISSTHDLSALRFFVKNRLCFDTYINVAAEASEWGRVKGYSSLREYRKLVSGSTVTRHDTAVDVLAKSQWSQLFDQKDECLAAGPSAFLTALVTQHLDDVSAANFKTVQSADDATTTREFTANRHQEDPYDDRIASLTSALTTASVWSRLEPFSTHVFFSGQYWEERLRPTSGVGSRQIFHHRIGETNVPTFFNFFNHANGCIPCSVSPWRFAAFNLDLIDATAMGCDSIAQVVAGLPAAAPTAGAVGGIRDNEDSDAKSKDQKEFPRASDHLAVQLVSSGVMSMRDAHLMQRESAVEENKTKSPASTIFKPSTFTPDTFLLTGEQGLNESLFNANAIDTDFSSAPWQAKVSRGSLMRQSSLSNDVNHSFSSITSILHYARLGIHGRFVKAVVFDSTLRIAHLLVGIERKIRRMKHARQQHASSSSCLDGQQSRSLTFPMDRIAGADATVGPTAFFAPAPTTCFTDVEIDAQLSLFVTLFGATLTDLLSSDMILSLLTGSSGAGGSTTPSSSSSSVKPTQPPQPTLAKVVGLLPTGAYRNALPSRIAEESCVAAAVLMAHFCPTLWTEVSRDKGIVDGGDGCPSHSSIFVPTAPKHHQSKTKAPVTPEEFAAGCRGESVTLSGLACAVWCELLPLVNELRSVYTESDGLHATLAGPAPITSTDHHNMRDHTTAIASTELFEVYWPAAEQAGEAASSALPRAYFASGYIPRPF